MVELIAWRDDKEVLEEKKIFLSKKNRFYTGVEHQWYQFIILDDFYKLTQ